MMTKWLTYLLEANVYLAAAYGAYWLLLRRQTFYTTNRACLLLSVWVSFAMPLVQLELPSSRSEAPIVLTQQVPVTAGNTNLAVATSAKPTILTLNKALETIFMVGVTVLVVSFLFKLYSVLKLIFNHQRQKRSGYTLVLIPNLPSPFSFLGYLFVANEPDLTPAVLQHELVHIRQKHSWDILLLELIKATCWFNPAVYLLQNSLKALHEYEADFESTAQGASPDEYVQALIARAYQVNGLPFANHFSNKQLLKSRIMKLYQNRSGKLARLTYLITLPLCAGMLCASTMAFSKNYGMLRLKLSPQLKPKNTSVTLTDDTQPVKKTKAKNYQR
jgi:beta-lactamase regulating signal transducer with metallopeptidase domain